MNELPGDCDGRLPVRLALAPLPEVVVVQRRLALELGRRRKVQGPAQVGRPLLRYVVRLALERPGLVSRRVDAGVLDDGGGVLEPAHVADLGDDLGAELVGDAGDRDDQRLDLVEQPPHPLRRLVRLALDELDLPGEELDLEGERVGGDRDAARALRRGLYLDGLLAAELAPARPVEQAHQRPDVDGGDLVGRGASLQECLQLSPNMSEKSPEYSGNTWSSATMTWRFRSAALSTMD